MARTNKMSSSESKKNAAPATSTCRGAVAATPATSACRGAVVTTPATSTCRGALLTTPATNTYRGIMVLLTMPLGNIWAAESPFEVLNEHLFLQVGRYVPVKVFRVRNKNKP